MRILSLDLGTQTGVAFAVDKGEPEFSTERLGATKSTHATICSNAMRMTNRLIKKYEPDILSVEAAFFHPKHPQAGVLLYKIHGAVLGVAKINDLHPLEYTVNEIRSFFINNTMLGRADAKATVKSACLMLGWDVKNDDEADAGALLEFTRAKAKLSDMMPTGGLF